MTVLEIGLSVKRELRHRENNISKVKFKYDVYEYIPAE